MEVDVNTTSNGPSAATSHSNANRSSNDLSSNAAGDSSTNAGDSSSNLMGDLSPNHDAEDLSPISVSSPIAEDGDEEEEEGSKRVDNSGAISSNADRRLASPHEDEEGEEDEVGRENRDSGIEKDSSISPNSANDEKMEIIAESGSSSKTSTTAPASTTRFETSPEAKISLSRFKVGQGVLSDDDDDDATTNRVSATSTPIASTVVNSH